MAIGNQYLRGGFAKGTRVQRRDKRCPIEEIAVGDEVLCGPNDCFGTPRYRPVQKVLRWQSLQVHALSYFFQEGDSSANTFLTMTDNVRHWSGLTPGWVPLAGLDALSPETKEQHWPSPREGLLVQPGQVRAIYRTAQAGVGWTENTHELEIYGRNGSFFNYADFKLVEPQSGHMDAAIYDGEDPYLCVDVYHLVVEEEHSFYVGQQLLVHDAFQKVLYNPKHYY